MTELEIVETELIAETQSALKRSLWPIRICAAFFLGLAAVSSVLFIYQAFIYRNAYGEPFLTQPGAWLHLSGHLIRGVVTALLAQRILFVLQITRELVHAPDVTTVAQFDRMTAQYFRYMRIWWTTFALCLTALLGLGIAAVAVPFYLAMNDPESVVYRTTDQSTAVRVAFHIAQNDPQEGYLQKTVAETKDVIYLQPQPFLTNRDIVGAQVIDSPEGDPAVGVKFAQRSVERIRQNTTVHSGKRLAILVDDVVIMAPTIRYTIGESAMLTGNFDREEAERIAKGIVGATE